MAKRRGGLHCIIRHCCLEWQQFDILYNVENVMDEISQKFGANLKKIRLEKKMSQGDICRALEVDRAYISNLESGKRNPTLATIKRIADALGVSVDRLLK